MMNKTIAYFIVLGIWMLVCGCGLIPMSYTRTLPHPIRSITVVDSLTTEIIPNAEVLCLYEQFVYKMMNIPPHAVNTFADRRGSVLPTVQQPDGTFRIAPQDVTASSGFFIAKDYIVTISAQADMYIPFSLRYFPNAKPHGDQTWQNGSHTTLTRDGHFIIFLEPITTIPIRTIVVRDALTKHPVLHAEVCYFYEVFHGSPGWSLRWSDTRFKKPIDEHVLPTVKHHDGRFLIKNGVESPLRRNALVTISAKAEGYLPFSLIAPAKAVPLGERAWFRGGSTLFTTEGIFTIYLEKSQ